MVGQARRGAAATGQGPDRVAGAPGHPGQRPGFDLTEAGTQKRLAVWLVDDPKQVPGIAALGPDALDIGAEDLAALLAGNTGRIKTVITDQKVIAGIGNAYSDEILHVAKISPFATAGKLSDEQLTTLHDAMISVLTDAVTPLGRPGGRHAQGGEALRAAGACPHRTAVSGVRGHRARSVVRRQVFSVLPDVSDRRQGAGRPAHVAAAQVNGAGGGYAARVTRQKILITGASSGLGAGMARVPSPPRAATWRCAPVAPTGSTS